MIFPITLWFGFQSQCSTTATARERERERERARVPVLYGHNTRGVIRKGNTYKIIYNTVLHILHTYRQNTIVMCIENKGFDNHSNVM